MKITRVDIEGMHNVLRKTYKLNGLNYLHGPNGIGKSTVMQAIQLALLGYIPGNNKASKEAIFRHANGHILAVTLYIEDNTTNIKISRVWSGTKSNINSSVEIEPAGYDIQSIIKDLELPIFNFNEFLNLTANKMKDWFIEFLPSAELSIDWNKVLTDEAQQAGLDLDDSLKQFIADNVSDIESMSYTGVDLVRNVNERFKTALSFKKKEVERVQSTIQSLIFYDDVDTSLTEAEIISKISTYEDLKATRNNAIKSLENNARIEAELKNYEDCKAESAELDPKYLKANKDYTNASGKIAESQADILKCNTHIAEDHKTISKLVDDRAELLADTRAKQMIVDSDSICPFTNTKCDSIKSFIDSCQAEIDANETKITELDNEINEANQSIKDAEETIQSLNSLINELTKQKFEYTSIMSDIQNKYRMKAQLRTQIVIVPDMSEDDRDFDKLISELRDMQIKCAANKKYNELIDKLTSDKYEADREVIAYKAWINLTGVNGLQNDTSAIEPFLNLQNDMNRYIQAVFGVGVTAKFNLESKANSFSFGIERDESYIPFNLLSSGEKCMYTLALMMSLTQLSNSPLKLVMIDDLLDHLDDVNVNKLFESLKTIDDIQMIFAGVKSVKGDFVVEVTNH